MGDRRDRRKTFSFADLPKFDFGTQFSETAEQREARHARLRELGRSMESATLNAFQYGGLKAQGSQLGQLEQLEAERDRLRGELNRESARRTALQTQVAGLQVELQQLRRTLEKVLQQAAASMHGAAGPGDVPSLTALLREFHPDRHPNGIDANALASRINVLRDQARGRR